jgi:hypothetical protein
MGDDPPVGTNGALPDGAMGAPGAMGAEGAVGDFVPCRVV